MDRSKLGDLLVGQGHVDESTRDDMLARQRNEPKRLGELLLEVADVEDSVLLELLARQHGVDAANPATDPPEDEAVNLLPPTLIQRWEAVPLALAGDALVLGMVDPKNRLAVDAISRATGYTEIVRKVITAAAFTTWVTEKLGIASALADAVEKGTASEVAIASPDVSDGAEPPADAAEDEPVVALVDHLLTEAVTHGASDVHLEPFETSTRIRMRLDGSLVTVTTVPRRLHGPMALRLCALAGADAGSGTLEATVDDHSARFRLSALSTLHGRMITLRRLDFAAHGLASLGLHDDVKKKLSTTLGVAHGLILVAGPRGSGRTTTALALAEAVNQPSRQVAVVTRTADAALPGMIVVPAGADMAAALEETLAQDPDVVVVDGMNDAKSRAAAARAAVEGHLVIATTGGGRAIDAVGDLVSGGVPAYQVAAALRAAIAQRLCRRIDPESAVSYTPSTRELEEFGIPADTAEKGQFKRPEPAASNHGTGYRGRVGVQEVLLPGTTLRTALRDGADPSKLLELARGDGFHTLWEDAILKVARGETTFEEIRAALIPPA